jgi:stearoyl-CoA desaturase (delta-9 desaturase)
MNSFYILLILLLGHWYSSLFFQTFFLHRYSSHKMFEMNKFWEKVFFLGTFLTQGTSFLNPAAYSILHQTHHAHSDEELDPHSPVAEPNFLRMMLKTAKKYYEAMEQVDNPPKGVAAIYPRWESLEKFTSGWILRLIWAASIIAIYYLLNMPAWAYLFLPLHWFMGPIHGAIVNWAGHKVGYRNFNSTDNSKNTLFIDFLMMGELYQNNHHRFPNKLKFSYRWFELDLGYYLAKVLIWLNIIRVNKQEYNATLARPIGVLDL